MSMYSSETSGHQYANQSRIMTVVSPQKRKSEEMTAHMQKERYEGLENENESPQCQLILTNDVMREQRAFISALGAPKMLEDDKMVLIFEENTGYSDILLHIFSFAVSLESVSPMAQTCKKWNAIINQESHTAGPIWQKIVAAEDPELVRIFPLCKEAMAIDASGGWKTLLRRRMTSSFKPTGKYKILLTSLETVFHKQGIWLWTCHYCDERKVFVATYDENIIPRNSGIYSIAFETAPSTDGRVHVYFEDFDYLMANWDTECHIIKCYFALWGLNDDAFTIYKPQPSAILLEVRVHVDLNALDPDKLPPLPSGFSAY